MTGVNAIGYQAWIVECLACKHRAHVPPERVVPGKGFRCSQCRSRRCSQRLVWFPGKPPSNVVSIRGDRSWHSRIVLPSTLACCDTRDNLNMAICKLCGNDRSLVRSHIIPDAFNRALKGEKDSPPKLISTNPEMYPKRQPGGLYEEIVCDECEQL